MRWKIENDVTNFEGINSQSRPALPPALSPCIGTPENWAQQTVVCFNDSLHCCIPWSSRKYHIPLQKFERKTLCNQNREGTKLEKEKDGPPSPSSSQFLWSMRWSLQIASTPRGWSPGWRIRNSRLRYHAWSPNAPTVYKLSQEPRDGHLLKSHFRREGSEMEILYALHILESLGKMEFLSLRSLRSHPGKYIHLIHPKCRTPSTTQQHLIHLRNKGGKRHHDFKTSALQPIGPRKPGLIRMVFLGFHLPITGKPSPCKNHLRLTPSKSCSCTFVGKQFPLRATAFDSDIPWFISFPLVPDETFVDCPCLVSVHRMTLAKLSSYWEIFFHAWNFMSHKFPVSLLTTYRNHKQGFNLLH